MIKHITISLLAIFFTSSCSFLDPCENKGLFIKNHTSFIEESVKNQDKYSDEDWEKRDGEFEAMIEDCYENIESQLDKSEKKAFWVRNTKYLSLRVKNSTSEGMEELTEVMRDLSEDGVALVEGFNEVFGEDFTESIDAFGDDMKEIFDEDFKNKMKEVFDEDFKNKMKDAVEKIEGSFKEIGEGLKEVLEEIK